MALDEKLPALVSWAVFRIYLRGDTDRARVLVLALAPGVPPSRLRTERQIAAVGSRVIEGLTTDQVDGLVDRIKEAACVT